jgi:hypothetical protein
MRYVLLDAIARGFGFQHERFSYWLACDRVVLKGIGTNTYKCLKNNPQEADDSRSNKLRKRSRRYLSQRKEIISHME